MADAAHPSEQDVRILLYEWYRMLDRHAPAEDYLPMLSADCRMVFPEATLEGKEGFTAWYRGGANLPGVLNLFFDEKHELKRLDVAASVRDGAWRADVLIVVKWEAHRWKAPDAKSDYLGFDAWQRCTMAADPQGRPVIREYFVDRMEKLQGSADL